MTLRTVIVALLLSLAGGVVDARAQQEAELELPINYVSYGSSFASAGQPTAEQLKALADDGFERIIYIAFSDQDRSLPHEDRLVRQLGMTYLHIPVDFQTPLVSEYELFAAAMKQAPEAKTLLHCQVNFRATAFSLLYRVIELGVPLKEAKAAMNAIWTPNAAWTEFLLTALDKYDIDPDCDGCDWTPAE